MISTTYRVDGMTTAADARAVKDALSAVPGIGAVATEIVHGGESKVILKHKDDVVPDRAAIEAAIRKAGRYRLS
ncbi:heavy-metal-associated domain-containing protein [Mycolicibacterium thermoresistibile]